MPFKYSGNLSKSQAETLARKENKNEKKLAGLSNRPVERVYTVEKEFEGPGKTSYAVFVTIKNPSLSASQYGMAQAVLSGRSKRIPKGVARELIDTTLARKRREFARELAGRRGNPAFQDERIQVWAKTAAHPEGYYWGTMSEEEIKQHLSFSVDKLVSKGKGKTGLGATIRKWIIATPSFYEKKKNPDPSSIVELLRDIREHGFDGSFVANVIQNWHGNSIRKLKGLRNLLVAGHEVRTGQFDLDTLIVDGERKSWGYLDEWSRIKRKGNPGESFSKASSLSESFHGREPLEIEDVLEEEKYQTDLAHLGDLIELCILDPKGKYEYPIEFEYQDGDEVSIGSNPEGTQYYFIGGDQHLDLDDLEWLTEDEKKKDKVLIGPVLRIAYYSDKHHLEGPKSQKDGCEYEHEFGEEGGKLPELVYDKLNERLEFVGGSYRTEDVGVRN